LKYISSSSSKGNENLSSSIKDFSLISPKRQASTFNSEDLDLDCVLLDFDLHSKSVSEKLRSTTAILRCQLLSCDNAERDLDSILLNMTDFPPNSITENARRHVSPGQDMKGQIDVEVPNLHLLSGETKIKATDDFHLMPPRPPNVADFTPNTGRGNARRRMSLGQVLKVQSDIVVPILHPLGGETTVKSANLFQTFGPQSSSLPNEDLDFEWCRYGIDIESIPSNVLVLPLRSDSRTAKKCGSKSQDEADAAPRSGRVMLASKSMSY
jgi:hypothetical protein